MKSFVRTALISTTILTSAAASGASFAQTGTATTTTTAQPAQNIRTVRVTAGGPIRIPADLDRNVSLEVNQAQIIDVIKQLMEAAKIESYTIDPSLSRAPITLVLKNVKLSSALESLSNAPGFAGLEVTVEETTGKPATIKISGRRSRTSLYLPGGIASSVSADISRDVERALAQAQRSAADAARIGTARGSMVNGASYSLFVAPRLPETRVRLDVRNSDIRNALKDILKQAGVDFALEDDVPENVKRSFTFENVPIETALDVVCKSAEVGWRAERVGGPATATASRSTTPGSPKILVRIGKKYVRRAGISDIYNLVAPGTLITPANPLAPARPSPGP